MRSGLRLKGSKAVRSSFRPGSVKKQPDLYARSLRFLFAVRLDRPYRYRVVTIYDDGQVHEPAWILRTSADRLRKESL